MRDRCRFFLPDGNCGYNETVGEAVAVQMKLLKEAKRTGDVNPEFDIDGAIRVYEDEGKLVPSGTVVLPPYAGTNVSEIPCAGGREGIDAESNGEMIVFLFLPSSEFKCNRYMPATPETDGKNLTVSELRTLVPKLPGIGGHSSL